MVTPLQLIRILAPRKSNTLTRTDQHVDPGTSPDVAQDPEANQNPEVKDLDEPVESFSDPDSQGGRLTLAQDIDEVEAETLIRISDNKIDRDKSGKSKEDRSVKPISKNQMLAEAEERPYTDLALEIQSHREKRLHLEKLYRKEEDLVLERHIENQRRRALETIRACPKIYDTVSEPESEVEQEQLEKEQPEEEPSQPLKSAKTRLSLKNKTYPPQSAQNSPDKSISGPARNPPIFSTPSDPKMLSKRKATEDAAPKTLKKSKLSDGFKAIELTSPSTPLNLRKTAPANESETKKSTSTVNDFSEFEKA